MTDLNDNPIRILIINPNTSTHMTDALRPAVQALGYQNVKYTFYTSPTPGIPSINSPTDALLSSKSSLPSLLPLLPHHDAFLIACYSQHPLVSELSRECAVLDREATNNTDTGSQAGSGEGGVPKRKGRKYVTGIFEASVLSSLAIVGGTAKAGFGIVSTGKIWEDALRDAVGEFLGINTNATETNSVGSGRFVSCRTTGLNASELHELPAAEVRVKMKDATRLLLSDGREKGTEVKAICLGCAGMVGLEEAVREACVEELGIEGGTGVAIVDGVRAGVGVLIGLVSGGF